MSSIKRSLAGGAIVLIALAAFGLRPAGGADRTHAPSELRIATVDMLILLERLMQTDGYRTANEEFTQTWNDQLQTANDDFQQLEARLIAMNPQDPAAQDVYALYQTRQRELGALQQQAYAEVDAFSARQLAEGYRTLHAEANRIAADKGFTHVVNTRLSIDTVRDNGTNILLQEVMIRPIIRSPEQDDLTDAVAAALDLPDLPDLPEDVMLPMPGIEDAGEDGR